MRTRITIAFLLICVGSFSQIDTNISLVAKIDAFPQFQLADGNQIYLMGYTQLIGAPIDIPSPTLNIEEGDSVQLNFWNLSQGPPHTIHLHGLDVNQINDGVPALSFAVAHDDTGSYYFKAPHPGTYIYHCHETSVLHVQAGMYGMVIVRPQSADTLTWEGGYSFHRENAWMTSEIDTNWHVDSIINHTYDPLATTHPILDYNPQHYLVNGRSNQQIAGTNSELVGAVGEKIYLRLANVGYYGNTFVFPSSLNAEIISSDGRPLPSTYFSDTLVVLPGERYGVLMEPSALLVDSVQINYFSLNTEEISNTQFVSVIIDGFLNYNPLIKQNVSVYPNPWNEELNVQIPNSNGIWKAVIVTDMIGKVVLEINFDAEKTKIDLSHMSKGSYVLNVIYENNKFSKLLIKE